MCVVWQWSQKIFAHECARLTGLSYDKVVSPLYAKLRDMCAQYLLQHPIAVGGHGMVQVVQGDESMMAHSQRVSYKIFFKM